MDKEEELRKLKKQMLADENLPLRKGATNLVLGEGNPNTKIMLLGEAPGFHEDKEGRPFIGAAGKFLDQLLHSIKLPREDVFVSNVICYRPPGNRDPQPFEIAAFQPYIDRLIEIIKPKIIVTLGRFSLGKFLPGARISSIHGKPQTVSWKGKDVLVVPMYHPAAALRNGQIMVQIKDDFLKLSEILQKKDEVDIEQMQLV